MKKHLEKRYNIPAAACECRQGHSQLNNVLLSAHETPTVCWKRISISNKHSGEGHICQKVLQQLPTPTAPLGWLDYSCGCRDVESWSEKAVKSPCMPSPDSMTQHNTSWRGEQVLSLKIIWKMHLMQNLCPPTSGVAASHISVCF